MSEELHFQITGEFVTKTAREWLWEEHKSYSVCEELLLNCLINDQLTLDERKVYAKKILEGELKLEGTNEFTIEHDDKKGKLGTITILEPDPEAISEEQRFERYVEETKFFLNGLLAKKLNGDFFSCHVARIILDYGLPRAISANKWASIIVPDDLEDIQGLISPTGEFYSCDFGGHNIKAYYLMAVHPELFGLDDEAKDGEVMKMMDRHNALDRLIKHGWLAVRAINNFFIDWDTSRGKRITKAQMDTVYRLMDKHRRRPINLEELEEEVYG